MLQKSAVAQYAAANPDTTELLSSGRLRFTETGMEFSATATTEQLKAYHKGRAYQRAVRRAADAKFDFDALRPYIVPHRERDDRHFLYCTLTRHTLPRNAATVQGHMAGRQYKARLAEAQKEELRRLEERERKAAKRAAVARGKAAQGNKTKNNDSAEQMNDDSDAEMIDHDDNGPVSDEDVLDGILSDSQEEDVAQDSESDDESNGENSDGMEDVRKPTRSPQAKGGKRARAGRADVKKHNSGQDEMQIAPRKRDGVVAGAVASRKRRVQVMVPKKVRLARQRRKTQMEGSDDV